jgi:hypothetical protein
LFAQDELNDILAQDELTALFAQEAVSIATELETHDADVANPPDEAKSAVIDCRAYEDVIKYTASGKYDAVRELVAHDDDSTYEELNIDSVIEAVIEVNTEAELAQLAVPKNRGAVILPEASTTNTSLKLPAPSLMVAIIKFAALPDS